MKMMQCNLADLNEQIRKCDRCSISKISLKTLGEGSTNPKIFFVAQKPHILKNVPLQTQKMLCAKYRPMFFTFNLRFYRLLNQAGLLGKQKEVQQKLDELTAIRLKDNIEEWWRIRGAVCRKLVEDNDLYITECLKCPTNNKNWNRSPSVGELQNCQEFLLAEIEILSPAIICCLGKDAAKALVGTKIQLEWGKTYNIFGHTVFHTYFPGQFSKIRDETRIKHFKKLKNLQ